MVILTNEEGASSSSSTCRWKYDVFLSFRGEDTRTGFTTYLYKALEQRGINTFMDDKLPRGEEISAELLKTIEESMILVIVFSKNYAVSKWCLNELVKIVECSENDQRVLLLPIFYNVEPGEVRNRSGNFGIALANHEKEFKDNMGKMLRWREALSKAASVSGWHYKEGSEYDFIQGIVKKISSAMFNRRTLYDAECLVGINSRVKDIKSLLNIESNEVRILGIHGLPGVGKTTIANVVYCLIAHQFEGSCFLEKVREKSINCGMIQLQEKLLSKILQDNNLKVDSEFEGTNLIKKRICCKKFLLVLDDVDNSEQIEKLLGKCDWFASGSIVIITTRDKHVLTTFPKGHLIYKAKELRLYEARDLFNMHAFRTNKPKEDYLELAEQIISCARGLPLALKVMGSDLCEKSICEWKSAFKMYKDIQHEKIQEILKISFLGLSEIEKNIFLDIACFFKGRNKDYVVKILDACNLYPDFCIGRLIDKCLITVEHGTFSMHDLLQQMGREIVQEESKQLENRSRIWCHKDANKLLTRNKGSDEIRGIMWCEPEPITESLKASAFEKMENLKFLIVENVQISEKLEYLPNELRLFEWPGYNFSLPSKFCPQKLVGLKVSCIGLLKLFEQGRHYKYLKSINFERCQSITRLPDLCAPNLERLEILYCENLIEIHESIGLLDKLEYLTFGHCMKLQILPSTLKVNKRFDICKCPRLEKFPNVVNRLSDFYVLDCNIREWPLSLGFLTEEIVTLEIQGPENLEDPIQKGFEIFLLEGEDPQFRIWHEEIDLDLYMKNDFFLALSCIIIDGSNIVSVPECIFRLSRLERIFIWDCEELREIQNPRLPQSIRHVEIRKCPSLLPQSSSRLLNQFAEILGSLQNRVPHFDDPESEDCAILLPGTEIPKSLKFNHQSFGNSISFKVGCKFPKLAVCFATRSAEAHIDRYFDVNVSINGWKQGLDSVPILNGRYEEVLLFSKSIDEWHKHNISEPNQVEVEVICKIIGPNSNVIDSCYEQNQIKWLGVNVECICCPQKSDITYLPLPSDRNGCGSSSVLNDTELPPFQPAFPTSYGFEPGLKDFLGDLNVSLSAPNNSELLALSLGPNMDHEVSNTVNDLRLLKGIHTDGCDLSLSLNDSNERESEPPLSPDLTNGFDFGFAQPNLELGSGDLNVSSSAPNNSELLTLSLGPNMDHEVCNTVNDLRLLKGIHNDGCDLSLSLNDSNERESEPTLFPDLTNGFDFGFAQPNLALGSGVSSGFHLVSSSMARASVNDDSDFYMGSSSMARDSVNDDSDFNMGPPPKKARTS